MMGFGNLEKVMTYFNYSRNVELSTDGGEQMGKTYHKAHVNLKSARGIYALSKTTLEGQTPIPQLLGISTVCLRAVLLSFNLRAGVNTLQPMS